MENKRGKLIAFYGVNNLGRSTQAKLLVEALRKDGISGEYVKFPDYGLEPTGSLIMNYLRDNDEHDFTKREFQLLNFINQNQKQIELEKKLDHGEFVICESYFGSAAAWGIGTGLDEEIMKHLYQSSKREDLAIFFDGEMFERSLQEHSKLDRDDELVNKVQEIQKEMAKEFDWKIINANKTVQEVHADIYALVRELFDR